MFKKVSCLLLAVIMLFSLSGCTKMLGSAFFLFLIATGDDRANKEDIFTFVCENEEALLTAVSENNFSAFEHRGIIKDVRAYEGAIDFSCGGAGVGSGTSYVGFYYTPDHDLTALWCAPSPPDSLMPSGDGFSWQQEDGDNRYYTERINGHFYYYEASF